jgi:hypothetical protein
MTNRRALSSRRSSKGVTHPKKEAAPMKFSLTAAVLSLPLFAASLRAQQWTAPTPEELSMTSIPEVPGAAAVYLYKEQITDDNMHMYSIYVREKILTEKGIDDANVELPYFTGENGTTIYAISGRTIHPDGTIIPFAGKPYDKLIAKSGHAQEKAKVFTLPAVEVGSIIEYRYRIGYDDNVVFSPDWMIQSDTYLRKAHYSWKPSSRMVTSNDGSDTEGHVMWTPILPEGAKVVETTVPGSNQDQLSLDVANVPPMIREEYMPPMDSVSYRVLFYYTGYRTSQEYWDKVGKRWSKERDKFIGPDSTVRDFAASLVAPADTQDQKARKLYDAVMQFENTDYTRARTTQEEKASGLKDLKDAGDIVKRKRGTGDQLAELYVGMARAVGLKAYLMGVADRSQRIFLPNYLSLQQIDDYIAIVNIDGKDVFFDPGTRYCEPEHLAWRHTFIGGLRQTDNGTALTGTPLESYKFSHVSRIADLKLDDHGVASGPVTLTFTGDPALSWRHVALRGDETSLKTDLKHDLEEMLPGGMDVTSVENLTDYTKPLKVKFDVKGAVGTGTGKRLMLPADLFEINAKPKFPGPKREVLVDMRYAAATQDAVRFTIPEGLQIESIPAPEKELMSASIAFDVSSKRAPNSVTLFRNLTVGRPIFEPKEYADLRGIYSKLETKDQETVVLTRATASASTPAGQPVVTVASKPSGN